MNIRTRHGLRRAVPTLMTAGLVSLAVLAAMSSSAGIQGSGFRSLLAVGTVTQTYNGNSDTLVVSGIVYSTSGAVFQIDGHAAAQAQIHSGDVVSLVATDGGDGGALTATQVTFNTSVQGRISAVDAASATLYVLGQTVHITSQTVFGSGAEDEGLAGLHGGDIVQVSGFANSAGELVATRIEAQGESGVSRVGGSVGKLDRVGHSFYINSLKVDYGSAQVDAVLADNAPVSVQGVKFAADGTLIASQVRSSAIAPGQPGANGRIQGLVTSYSSSAYFEVDGQPVIVVDQTKLQLAVPIGPDVQVKVTGTFDTSGALVADSVQSSK